MIAGCGGYRRIQDEGVDLTRRTTLNVVGAGATVTDDGTRTVLTIPGGGSTPVFDGAKVYNSTAVTVVSGTALVVPYDSTRFDTNGWTGDGSPRLRNYHGPGYFMFFAAIRFPANATGYRQAAFRFNGTTYFGIQTLAASPASGPTDLAITAVVYLDSANYIELILAQDSGSSLSVASGAQFSPEWGVVRLGNP
jgi:hypothetical protein